MTRARTIWLAILAIGLALALLLRAPREPRTVAEPRPASSVTPRSDDDSEMVEIEVADPNEIGIAAPAKVAGAETASEVELLRTLGSAWQSDPERALALADEGEKRFGESPRAVERRFYEIKALVTLGRIGSARTKAERYLAAYPPGPMTDEVERLTGTHRRPEPEKTP